MSEPNNESAASGLVEPQGVNAASQADEEPGDVRSGGNPEQREQMTETTERGELVGPPDQGAAGPGQELALGEG